MLSQAGKEVLIKSMAQAIPTSILGCFLLPQGLCDHVEALISQFWCGSKNGERKIHWVKRFKLCERKMDGGRDRLPEFSCFQFGYSHGKDSKSSVLPKTECIACKGGLYAKLHLEKHPWVLHRGGYWRVGNGVDIYIWKDACWISQLKMGTGCGHNQIFWRLELIDMITQMDARRKT